MNILLTGSGGFIGTHLKSYLKKGYNLFTPRSYELNLLDRLAVKKYIETNNINFIIHSASCGVRINQNATLEEVAEPNIKMFDNLASATNRSCPMITFGSGAEYDKSQALIKVKEDVFGKSIPQDPYGYSKYIISKEIEKREHILNLRLFGIYGFGEDKSRVTSCIINDNLSHNPIMLNQNVVFDFIWIDDFCKVVKHFIDNPTKEKFINVTPSESTEIVKLAEMINSFSDYKSEIIINNKNMNKEYTGDNTKLLNEVKDFKFTPYEEGLKTLYKQIADSRQFPITL